MRRAAANHRAEGDDGRVLPGARETLTGQRDFKGAGHANHAQLFRRHAVTFERIERSLQEVLDDKAVPAPHHERVAAAAGGQGAFDGVQGSHGMVSVEWLL